MRDAQGNQSYHEHHLYVKVHMFWEHSPAATMAPFEVADLKGAILSAGKLVQRGFEVTLAPHGSYLEMD